VRPFASSRPAGAGTNASARTHQSVSECFFLSPLGRYAVCLYQHTASAARGRAGGGPLNESAGLLARRRVVVGRRAALAVVWLF
jgi:hypothetical protein